MIHYKSKAEIELIRESSLLVSKTLAEVAKIVANVSPLAALVVAGALYLPRRAAWIVPCGALFISTVLLNVVKGFPVLSFDTLAAISGFFAIFALSWQWRGQGSARVSFPTVLGVTALSSVVFYLWTNTASFALPPNSMQIANIDLEIEVP